jgi:hypothetical protein
VFVAASHCSRVSARPRSPDHARDAGIGNGWRDDAYYDTLQRDWYGGPSFQGAAVLVSISATLLPVRER